MPASGWLGQLRLGYFGSGFRCSFRAGIDQFTHDAGFCDYLTIDGGDALHFGDGGLQPAHFHFNSQLIARHNRLAEFGFVDGSEEHELASGLWGHFADEDAGHLRHGFDDHHAGHDGEARKMSGEERLIAGDVLYADDRFFVDLENPVHEQHRIAMRQDLLDFLNVEGGHEKTYDNSRDVGVGEWILGDKGWT